MTPYTDHDAGDEAEVLVVWEYINCRIYPQKHPDGPYHGPVTVYELIEINPESTNQT